MSQVSILLSQIKVFSSNTKECVDLFKNSCFCLKSCLSPYLSVPCDTMCLTKLWQQNLMSSVHFLSNLSFPPLKNETSYGRPGYLPTLFESPL